jgi:hypothetical protein
MRNNNRNCQIAKGLYRVEMDARRKANRTSDTNSQLAYGLVAISLQLHRFHHEDHCPCCATAMAVAA